MIENLKFILILILIIWLAGAMATNKQKQNESIVGPKVQQLCYDNFIGTEYNPKLETTCRRLWNDWTDEIKYNKKFN